jgi:hypothetical protein
LAQRWRWSAASALFPAAVQYMVPINAFLMAMAAALFIHFASPCAASRVETIVLLGIALVFTFNALLSLVAISCLRAGAGRRGVLDDGQPDQGDLAEGLVHHRRARLTCPLF